MSCLTTITIRTISTAPCCSWKISRQYPCNNPLARLYTDGLQEEKLFARVRIRRESTTAFSLTDAQTSVYINYEQEDISIDGTPLDKEVVGLEDFEQYLHNLFCCATEEEEEIACGAYILAEEESNASCADDVGTFQVIIVNNSSGSIPAGTVFNLNWTGLGSNPVFSMGGATGLTAAVSINGTTLTVIDNWAVSAAVQINVDFDNVGCEAGSYSVSITPSACFTLSPDPLVISAIYGA